MQRKKRKTNQDIMREAGKRERKMKKDRKERVRRNGKK